MSAFSWTEQRLKAARLVADDKKSDQAIADFLGITQRTLERWKLEPDFKVRVQEHVEAYRAAVMTRGIADKVQRVADLDDRKARLQRIVLERAMEYAETPEAEDEEKPYVAGGASGLLVHQRKAIGQGRSTTIIDEYVLDAALLREMRAHEEQAARELGQWSTSEGVLRTSSSVAYDPSSGILTFAQLVEVSREVAHGGGDSEEA